MTYIFHLTMHEKMFICIVQVHSTMHDKRLYGSLVQRYIN